MTRSQRIFTLCLWTTLLVTMVGVIGAKFVWPLFAKKDPAPEKLYPADRFVLTDQNEKPFSSDSLRGKPYIASFMFTKCNGICPRMNGVVKGLQTDLPAEFHFVSITVDPTNDTAKTLKSYAATMGADESRWHFLTGDMATLQQTALGMKVSNQDWPANHSDRLILVDAEGNIRKTYHCREEQDVQQLIKDSKALLAEGSAIVRAGGPRS